MSRMRWLITGGSFLAYMFDALELILLSLALPAIRQDFHLTPLQGGFLATATLLGVGVSSVLVGYVADNSGRKKALVGSLVVFGAFTALLAIVPSFEVFVLLRFLAGLGLGGVWSVVSTYTVEAWPSEKRGRAVAFVLSSFPAGGIVAAQLSGLFLPNWRLLFLIAGLGVVLPVAFVAAFFRESDIWAAQKEAKVASRVDQRVSVKAIFTPSVRSATILATVVCALTLSGWWGGSTWLPTYLKTERGISAATVTAFITALNLGMFVGYNVFGLIADRIGKRQAITLSLFGMAGTLPLIALTSNQSALLWFGPLFAFFAAFTGIFGSYLGELFSTETRATGAGFCFNVGRGVSAFAPIGLPVLSQATSLSTGLIACAGLFAAAGLLTFALPRTESRPIDVSRVAALDSASA